MIKPHLLTAAGVLVVSLAFAMSGPGRALADKLADVVVTNTAANPVPTSAVGTTTVAGSVSVSNTPAVAQSGVWTVGLSGPVTVGNAVLPVRDVDNRDRNLVWLRANVNVDTGIGGSAAFFTESGTSTAYTVPAGKRLILDYVNMNGNATSGAQLNFQINVNPLYYWLNFTCSDQGISYAFPSFDNWVCAHDLHAAVEAGWQVEASLVLSTTSARASTFVYLSGHLVDVP